jgi:hypothetical protein
VYDDTVVSRNASTNNMDLFFAFYSTKFGTISLRCSVQLTSSCWFLQFQKIRTPLETRKFFQIFQNQTIFSKKIKTYHQQPPKNSVEKGGVSGILCVGSKILFVESFNFSDDCALNGSDH